MKLAYVTTYDASDISHWSGLGYHIAHALERPRIYVDHIGPLRIANNWFHLGWKASLYPLKKRHLTERQPDVLRSYARQINARLPQLNPDVVFAPGSVPVSLLDCEPPIVFWTDATFAGLHRTYPEFQNVLKESIDKGEAMEQAALSRCSLAIYSSHWAAQTAIHYYNVDPKKVIVVPFGANLDPASQKSPEAIEHLIDSRLAQPCRLLFLGVEWQRKGGDVAVDITRLLNRAGLPAELHVAGCVPDGPLPDFVTVHGHISKSSASGRATLEKLFAQSRFLIQPSRAECYGLAFAEASAYGVPSLASNVGGIPTVVRDGVNGITFDPLATPSDYANFILETVADEERYRLLSRSAYAEFRDRLNWDVAGRTVTNLLQRLVRRTQLSTPAFS